MINVAIYLKSESCDSYLYLYKVKTSKDALNKLVSDNYEFETGCICDYEVESNDLEFNQQVSQIISEYLDSIEDREGEED